MLKQLFVLACLLLPLGASARQGELQIGAKTHTFPNGLQLIVVERDWSPTVAFVVRFKAGPADEHPGSLHVDGALRGACDPLHAADVGQLLAHERITQPCHASPAAAMTAPARGAVVW